MNHIDPPQLIYSWPLFEASARIRLEPVLGAFGGEMSCEGVNDITGANSSRPIGLWSCDLRDNRLTWSPAVHELFGIPVGETLTRSLAVSCYGKHSMMAMEELRAHAIRHRRGFTMDAMIRQPDGDKRWMRLSAMPIIEGAKVVRLCGTKQDVTVDYDGPGWQAV